MPFQYPGPAPIESGDTSTQSQMEWQRKLLLATVRNQKILGLSLGLDSTGMGILAYGESAEASFALSATIMPSMRIHVGSGAGFINFVPVIRDADGLSPLMEAPEAADRIDTICVDGITSEVVILTGIEDAAPVAPEVNLDQLLKVGEVYHRPGETGIHNADTSGEGYIVDNQHAFNV